MRTLENTKDVGESKEFNLLEMESATLQKALRIRIEKSYEVHLPAKAK
jgi:hypothetical protein